jgi:hypothetical protein
MISLCLQCCPLDLGAAMELTELICELEPVRREETEFFLVYRRDCAPSFPKLFNREVSKHFGRAQARPARNFAVGWPAGSNMLAGSCFIELSILRREGICRSEAFLLFEPDTLPMRRDWIDQLSAEWERTKGLGKEAFGHWHQQGGPETLHMNGNAVFRTDFYDRHPQWIIGPGLMGWDYWFRDQIIPISRDSNLVFQHYGRHGITLEQLEAISKNGERPALFHGVKTADGRQNARKMLIPAVATPPLSVAHARR